MLLAVVGCGVNESANDKERTAPIEIALLPAGQVQLPHESITQILSPPKMRVRRSLTLRSKLTTDLTQMKVISSCGCTSAVIDKSTLAPDDTCTLTCTFDVDHNRSVTVRLVSPDIPTSLFEIKFVVGVLNELEEERIVAVPEEIVYERLWAKENTDRSNVRLTCGRKVPIEQLKFKSSSAQIRVAPGSREGNEVPIALEFANIPVCNKTEEIIATYQRGDDEISLKLPIRCVVKGGFEPSPRTISSRIGPENTEKTATIKLTPIGSRQSVPVVKASGDCEYLEMQQDGDSVWKVRIAMLNTDKKRYGYGTVSVSGDWDGADIVIPVVWTAE